MEYFNLILTAIRNGFVWATAVFEQSGMLTYLLGVTIITIVYIKLLAPLMRGAGSDRVKRRKENNE